MKAIIYRLYDKWKIAFLGGSVLGLFLLLLWNTGTFSGLRLALQNVYFLPAPTTNSIVIIAIDNDSLATYGRTPAEWSRALFGEVATIVSADNARVLAYDLIFNESSPDDEAFAQALLNARQSDARTRIVLAAAGAEQPTNNLTIDNFHNGLQYRTTLQPNSTLRANADYIGYVNTLPDVDARIRRQPTLFEINNKLHYAFSLSVFFAHRRLPESAVPQVISSTNNQLHLMDNLTLPVDEYGLWLQNFFGEPYTRQPSSTFPVISFHDVINKNFETGLFKDKIVLVGLLDSLSSTDQYLVPSSATGTLMAGVEIQAHAIETLLAGIPLIPQSNLSQALMIVGLTVITSLIYNRTRWYWKFVLFIVMWLIFFSVAFVLFILEQQVINLFYGSIAILLPTILTTGLEISQEVTRRRRIEFLLKSVVTISQQQMMIDSILPLIANDIQLIVGDSSGIIRLYPSDQQSSPKDYYWQLPVNDRSLSQSLANVQEQLSLQHDKHHLAIPIIWQSKTLGAIAIKKNGVLSHQEISLIQELVERLAPNLDNINLHRSIDQQNRLLELVLTNSPASIIVLDPSLMIIRANRTFASWLATGPQNLIGHHFLETLSQQTITEETREHIQQQFNTGGSFTIEIRDNFKRILRFLAVPLNELSHWVIILVDISDLVQLNELKTQMIRMASYDIKNPLSRILGYTELVKSSTDIDPVNQRFLQNVMNASTEINDIITDILDIEQLNTGKIQRAPSSFKSLVAEIYLRHEPDKDRKQQSMSLELPDNPILVNMDHLRLGQAISNLISNAIKYTPDEGNITVRIRQPDSANVILEVEDNGYGIPQEAQEKLFTEFYRVKTRDTRNISGTGLGLSLVKSVAQAHEGEVWFTSTEHVGSTFYMRLPIYDGSIQQ